MKKYSRRKMLGLTGLAAGGFISTTPIDHLYPTKETGLKILITGAHPDDPETGCGGSMLYFRNLGHRVTALYLTRGEAGISGISFKRTAEIRTNEAKNACEILGAKPIFAKQTDGNTTIGKKEYENVKNLIKKEEPDIVFTHWPIDTHRDHRITSLLVYDAWLNMNKNFDLYYYEVMTGEQTQNFKPDCFIDISDFEKLKRKACFCHQSQDPEEMYAYHKKMSSFRGLEYNCIHAEAFIRHDQNKNKLF